MCNFCRFQTLQGSFAPNALYIDRPVPPGPGNREAAGALAPPTFAPKGRRPSNFELSMLFIFYFCLFLHENLGPSQKNSERNPGVFSFGEGLPWTAGDVSPPPPTSKSFPSLWCPCLKHGSGPDGDRQQRHLHTTRRTVASPTHLPAERPTCGAGYPPRQAQHRGVVKGHGWRNRGGGAGRTFPSGPH